MSGSAAFEAYGILAGFGMGIVIGVIAMVAVAIRKEGGKAVVALRRGAPARSGRRRPVADRPR